jgi:RNA polymerase-associated protein RTF1
MILKKKSLSRIPKNIVHEKTRLKQLRLAAISSGNESEVEKIQDQLAQLEELAQGKRDKAISRENEAFLKVNERNRKINIVEMKEAERRGAEERRRAGIFHLSYTNAALSTDMAVMDPFSRRKTIPKTFYENLQSSRSGSPAPSSGVTTPILAPTSVAVPDNLVLDTPTNGKKGKAVKVDDVIAQADFGIDIEI